MLWAEKPCSNGNPHQRQYAWPCHNKRKWTFTYGYYYRYQCNIWSCGSFIWDSSPKPLNENKTAKCRRWKSLDLDAFKYDICMSYIHLILESNSMSDAVRTYDTILHNFIDKYAPEYDRTFKSRHHTPWYNNTVRDSKCLRRKLERCWRKTRSEPDREAYRYQCQVVRDELVKARTLPQQIIWGWQP